VVPVTTMSGIWIVATSRTTHVSGKWLPVNILMCGYYCFFSISICFLQGNLNKPLFFASSCFCLCMPMCAFVSGFTRELGFFSLHDEIGLLSARFIFKLNKVQCITGFLTSNLVVWRGGKGWSYYSRDIPP
jgi:hypothetical protein